MPLMERMKVIKTTLKWWSESRRDVKASNVDSEENCDIESSGGCADDSEMKTMKPR